MSEGTNVRRQYIKRSGEFNDMPVETVRARIVTEIANQASLKASLVADPENADLKKQLKDSINFNVRAYRRCRDLGFPCKPKKAEAVAAPVAPVTDVPVAVEVPAEAPKA